VEEGKPDNQRITQHVARGKDKKWTNNQFNPHGMLQRGFETGHIAER